MEFKLIRIRLAYDDELYYQCKDARGNNWTLIEDEIQAWK